MNRNFNILFFCLIFMVKTAFSQNGSYIPLSLDKIFTEYHFYPADIDGIRTMADGEHYTMLEHGGTIVSYDYSTGRVRNVLFSPEQLQETGFSGIDDYEFSSDESRILLTTGKSNRYRYSYEANYTLFDRTNGRTEPVSGPEKVSLASFSPDGTRIAYVKNNNLYYYDLTSHAITQVTSDGLLNSIINGAPDWVYEEEFSLKQAYCWSPDSRKIAFFRFDESEVPEFDMTLFYDLYPQTYRFKYPQAGERNSVIQIRVFDTHNGQTTSMDVGSERDQYIPRIKWTSWVDTLCIMRLNRLQNKVDVLLSNARTGSSRTLFTEENSRFISEINDHYIHFTPDGRYFIIRSERSGYFQYYLYSLSGKCLNPVTQGDWDTDAVLGIDDRNRIMYYTSREESPLKRTVYSVRFDGSHKTRLSEYPGTNSAEFSRNFSYYVNTWSDANTPPRITIHKINGKLIRVIEDNNTLKHDLKVFGFAQKKFIRIPVKDNLMLNAYLVLPPDFDSSRVYPLFIKVYGGPEAQDVTDAWDNDLAWQQYLAQKGIVIACIDNRGTDGRGEAFRKSTYMELGKLETEDQINAALYLGRKSWIDENRIGIWGWSYGGYMTLLCMTRGAGLFKIGIAVAPVTNWRFYDTIYTERFMRTPQENPDGYDLNSPIHFTNQLRGKLLLVHGTGDDNVHFQNSVEFSDQLIMDNKQFEEFFYPNKNHNISGGNTRFHLFSMLSRFVLDNL
jgi:dipeptidyl-peptidase-4